MKYYLYILVVFVTITSCKTAKTPVKNSKNEVIIDLVNVVDDKVSVNFTPGNLTKDTAVFYIPRIVPGTYSSDNYGAFITNFKVVNKNGEELPVEHPDKNSWKIANAKNIAKISYQVNDTYDIESEHDVFSPSGTNILKDKNFILNLHGFVGYFKETQELPYLLSIIHPTKLEAATSHQTIPQVNKTLIQNEKQKVDTFLYDRYAEVTDDPILYAELDNETFKVNDIEVLLSVYSPNKIRTAKELLPSMKKMMTAQKAFMGDINSTKKYSILLYLSDYSSTDAQGFGALEHNNSTVVVLPEAYPFEAMEEIMIDIVSHEFFHIITPLTVHSKEIHNFDYYEPKMSEHLWMYEGTTEYFAQLFQIKEGIVSKEEFYNRLAEKIMNSYRYNDKMSFTKMSKNILEEPFKTNYNNVYEKGALISMCLDIILREKSEGKKGILDLMKSLSGRYGAKKAFSDNELINVVAELTYPEVKQFLITHVVGDEPINYDDYFKKVGLSYGSTIVNGQLLLDGEIPYLSANQEKNQLYFNEENGEYNSFLKSLNVQPNDILISVNGQKYDLNNARYLFEVSQQWKVGDKIEMIVSRNGTETTLTTTIESLPTTEEKTLTEIPESELTPKQLLTKNSWLN